MSIVRNELYLALSVNQKPENIKRILSIEEDKILTTFQKSTSVPLQEIVDRIFKKNSSNTGSWKT